MVRMIEKSMLLGLGILTLTRDRVVQMVNSMVAEGEVKEEEASNIIDRLVARGEEEREELRNLVRDELDKFRINVPMASRKDIEELSQKIDELSVRIDEMAGKKPEKK